MVLRKISVSHIRIHPHSLLSLVSINSSNAEIRIQREIIQLLLLQHSVYMRMIVERERLSIAGTGVFWCHLGQAGDKSTLVQYHNMQTNETAKAWLSSNEFHDCIVFGLLTARMGDFIVK